MFFESASSHANIERSLTRLPNLNVTPFGLDVIVAGGNKEMFTVTFALVIEECEQRVCVCLVIIAISIRSWMVNTPDLQFDLPHGALLAIHPIIVASDMRPKAGISSNVCCTLTIEEAFFCIPMNILIWWI